jgi:hypothetical protein
MENKDSKLILNKILENVLMEQTGLVYDPINKNKKNKQEPPKDDESYLDLISDYWPVLAILGSYFIPKIIGAIFKRKSGGGTPEQILAKRSLKDLALLRSNFSTPQGLDKFKRILQRKYEKGLITKAERNEILELLDNPRVLVQIRSMMFNDAFNKFKRGQYSARKLIDDFLDLETKKEYAPILIQMEKDGLGGIKDDIASGVAKSIAKIKKFNLPVKTEEEFNKKIQDLDKAGKLKSIYGESFYNKWKNGKMDSGNWLGRAISKLRSETLRGDAYIYQATVKTIDDYVKLLKYNDLPVPTDVGDLNRAWKDYQLKQLFKPRKK